MLSSFQTTLDLHVESVSPPFAVSALGPSRQQRDFFTRPEAISQTSVVQEEQASSLAPVSSATLGLSLPAREGQGVLG